MASDPCCVCLAHRTLISVRPLFLSGFSFPFPEGGTKPVSQQNSHVVPMVAAQATSLRDLAGEGWWTDLLLRLEEGLRVPGHSSDSLRGDPRPAPAPPPLCRLAVRSGVSDPLP